MSSQKRMLLFMAVNALTANVATSNNVSIHKNDALYNKMIKNINSNKSNKKNYKLIEDILNGRYFLVLFTIIATEVEIKIMWFLMKKENLKK